MGTRADVAGPRQHTRESFLNRFPMPLLIHIHALKADTGQHLSVVTSAHVACHSSSEFTTPVIPQATRVARLALFPCITTALSCLSVSVSIVALTDYR
jgi:hypothetical protein